MKRNLFVLLLLVVGSRALAQNTAPGGEEKAVKSAINQLFQGMLQADSALAAGAFDRGVVLQTIKTGSGNNMVQTDQLNSFLSFVARGKKGRFEERIVFTHVHIDGPLASVWTDYQFFNSGIFSHCGVNSFQLVKKEGGWKIVHLIDTRRKEPCKPQP
ncbi:hypothetical protein C7T94_04480 [Pedobacter yulinensis]|uniref:Nuclear transport factor 2 family protein n=1 Tax=Pedobacter yulinensis TaxID=2126353 RepID=A0A2T3HNJ1_9SPHI|nr:nuclear transport factor 2 family protein [Pedobacter yulinensis]PST83999.1 hypothetical protein C7T94_04480 [Pedobacter yulinensis]